MPGFDHHDGERDNRPRVLIVEPRRDYLSLFARRLTQGGFKVTIAGSVASAIAALYRSPVELVLTEYKAPHFCGRELLALIRGDVGLRDIPVLVFSGRSQQSDSVSALQSGADAVIYKPFDFEVVCARIHRELQRKRAIDDLRNDNRTLDARVTERAIAIGEIRDQLAVSEAKLARLQAIIGDLAR